MAAAHSTQAGAGQPQRLLLAALAVTALMALVPAMVRGEYVLFLGTQVGRGETFEMDRGAGVAEG